MGECSIETYDESIIKVVLTKVHLKKDIDALFEQVDGMIRTTGRNKIFLDIGGIEEISGGARRTMALYISEEPRMFRKLAMCGPGAKNRVMARFIISASGRGNNVRYFDNENEALEWLKE